METADLELLQSTLEKHESVLAEVRLALSQEGYVPIDYDQGFEGLSDRVGPIRQAFRLVWLDGRVQELQGNSEQAALTTGRSTRATTATRTSIGAGRHLASSRR